MSNPYLPKLAVIKETIKENENTLTLIVALQKKITFNPEPGQFIELSLFGHGEFPVSIAGVIDKTSGVFQVTIRKMGGATEKVVDLKQGSTIGIRGPLGKGYPLAQMEGKDVILIAGGLGIASIKYLAERLMEDRSRYKRIILLYGARSPQDLVLTSYPLFNLGKTEKASLETFVAVDQPDSKWKGNVGNVINLYETIESGIKTTESIVAACGPSTMMKAVVDCFTHSGFTGEQLILSFERRMQCGIGKCGHCTIGEKRVCMDGPVIAFHEIKNTIEEFL